jgi:hypothetical protein
MRQSRPKLGCSATKEKSLSKALGNDSVVKQVPTVHNKNTGTLNKQRDNTWKVDNLKYFSTQKPLSYSAVLDQFNFGDVALKFRLTSENVSTRLWLPASSPDSVSGVVAL